MKRTFALLLALSVLGRPAAAENFHLGPEGVSYTLVDFLAYLMLCPIAEPSGWFKGRSLFKQVFVPDRIRIETIPSGADVVIFVRRVIRHDVPTDIRAAELKRFRGVSPVELRTPHFYFGTNSRYTLLLSKPGYKPRIEEMKVSGSAKHVFTLEPLAPRIPGGRDAGGGR
jgi:hypothetical protein